MILHIAIIAVNIGNMLNIVTRVTTVTVPYTPDPVVAADVLPGRGLLGGARHRLHLRPRHQAQVRGLQGGLHIDIYLQYLQYLQYPGGVSRGVSDQAAGEAGLQENLCGRGPELQRSPRCCHAVNNMQCSV